MTTRWDPFRVTHKKELKNKQGVVVAELDYIQWSQAAERLDEAEEVARWSFAILSLGQDWAHGRLVIVDKDGNESAFENIGYAENADQEWKKEALKDAASDAFKRCAALSGVGRYLYDTPASGGGRGASSPARQPAPTRPTVVHDNVPDEPADMFADRDEFAPIGVAHPGDLCDEHGVEWRGETGDLYHKKAEGGYCRHPGNTKKARRA